MVFCNNTPIFARELYKDVTILILVDGFLQSYVDPTKHTNPSSHNPYFSRWFSAIRHEESCKIEDKTVTILILVDGFLQLIIFITLMVII